MPTPRVSSSLVILGAFAALVGCRDQNAKSSPNATSTKSESASRVARPFDGTKQLLVVLGSGWKESSAELLRFERTKNEDRFVSIGRPEPAVIGRDGLGVGIGLVEFPFGSAPSKVEGDGRAPAGLFRLESAFGVAAAPRTDLPYRAMSEADVCVDDPNDPDYGRIVPLGARSPKSFEWMKRKDDLYELGITIGHNSSRKPGYGSCIFLHVWRSSEKATSGCTALARENVFSIADWLDGAKEPLLLQIPRTELASIASLLEKLGLPLEASFEERSPLGQKK